MVKGMVARACGLATFTAMAPAIVTSPSGVATRGSVGIAASQPLVFAKVLQEVIKALAAALPGAAPLPPANAEVRTVASIVDVRVASPGRPTLRPTMAVACSPPAVNPKLAPTPTPGPVIFPSELVATRVVRLAVTDNAASRVRAAPDCKSASVVPPGMASATAPAVAVPPAAPALALVLAV